MICAVMIASSLGTFPSDVDSLCASDEHLGGLNSDAYTPHNFLSCTSLPLNLSRSQRPIPLTVCGLGPRAPSVYCHIVQVFQFLGTTGVGPYCASQNQHSAKIGSALVPSNCLM